MNWTGLMDQARSAFTLLLIVAAVAGLWYALAKRKFSATAFVLIGVLIAFVIFGLASMSQSGAAGGIASRLATLLFGS